MISNINGLICRRYRCLTSYINIDLLIQKQHIFKCLFTLLNVSLCQSFSPYKGILIEFVRASPAEKRAHMQKEMKNNKREGKCAHSMKSLALPNNQ